MNTIQKRVRWTPAEWNKFFLSMDIADSSLSQRKKVEQAMSVFPVARRRKVTNNSAIYDLLSMWEKWKASGGELDLSDVYVRAPKKPSEFPRKRSALQAKANVAEPLKQDVVYKSDVELKAAVAGPVAEPKSLSDILFNSAEKATQANIPTLQTKKLLEQLNKTQADIEANIEEARRLRNQAEEVRKRMPQDLQAAMKEIQRGLENQVGAMEIRMTAKMEAMYEALTKMWLGPGHPIPPLALTTPVTTGTPVPEEDVVRKQLAQALTKKPKVLVFGVLPSQQQSIQAQLPSLEVIGTKNLKKAQGDYNMVVVMTQKVNQTESDYFHRKYADKCLLVRGGVTSIISSIKNHLMLA